MGDSVLQAFLNGYQDRAEYGLLRVEQLYRRPALNRAAWRAGWEVANVLARRPLRTDRKRAS